MLLVGNLRIHEKIVEVSGEACNLGGINLCIARLH